MKFLYSALLFSLIILISAQEKIYHPEEDAKAEIAKALRVAQSEGKNLVIQVGGNWCKWCILFDKYVKSTPEVTALVNDNFEYYHLNYSKENKNQDLLDAYGNPEENGFPVLLILNSNGKLLHTQETGSLEQGEGYDKEKVIAFFTRWLPEKNEPVFSH